MKATNINAAAGTLIATLHFALIESVQRASNACQLLGNTPQEPDFVADLVLNFPASLAAILRASFPSMQFAVTGIYCHQKPIVDIGMKINPELGDILFVYVYRDAFGKSCRNSLLLQAKITSTETTAVPAGDVHQLTLYERWPDFTYFRAGKLNGVQRKIQPKVACTGGQYLLIDNDPVNGLSGKPYTFPMGCALAADPLSLHDDFATELFNFLKFKTGRTFEADPNTTKYDWTKMIWDLLEIAKGKARSRRNMGWPNFPRTGPGADGLCFFDSSGKSIMQDLHDVLLSSGGGGGEKKISETLADEEGGISVVIIESFATEINEENR